MRPGEVGLLIVGGTGILRPAVEALLHDGRAVTVVGRSADRLAQLPSGAAGVLGDLDEPHGLRAALAQLPAAPTAALVYLPGSASPAVRAAFAALRRAVAGPVVALLTSAVAAPDPDSTAAEVDFAAVAAGIEAGEPADLRVLILGWVPPSADGPARWHTPEEISAAALAGLDDPRPRRLGVLRPWTQRPG